MESVVAMMVISEAGAREQWASEAENILQESSHAVKQQVRFLKRENKLSSWTWQW